MTIFETIAEALATLQQSASEAGETKTITIDGCDWTPIVPEHPELGRYRFGKIEITVEPTDE